MCILCKELFPDQFDVEHMKLTLKKLSIQEKKNKAIDIKVAIKIAERNKVESDNSPSGVPGYAQCTISHMREAQYLLSQFL